MKNFKSHFLALLVSVSVSIGTAMAQSTPRIEVFKSRECGCCEKWVTHLKQSGFDVVAKDVTDVPAARKSLGMPERFGSCHTARVGNYLVEGHVPAEDIHRLLKERPKGLGIAVPGMPQGSPGMESPRPQPYETLLVQMDGSATVFSKH